MKPVHVECKPDEAFIKKMGFAKKLITHHTGKSRVFHKLKTVTNELAIVDEDPGSAKTTYEQQLHFIEERHGVKYYRDNNDNKILVLRGKLEDWILNVCNEANIDPSQFGFPTRPNDFHNIINQRIPRFELLVDRLIEKESSALSYLKGLLN